VHLSFLLADVDPSPALANASITLKDLIYIISIGVTAVTAIGTMVYSVWRLPQRFNGLVGESFESDVVKERLRKATADALKEDVKVAMLEAIRGFVMSEENRTFLANHVITVLDTGDGRGAVIKVMKDSREAIEIVRTTAEHALKNVKQDWEIALQPIRSAQEQNANRLAAMDQKLTELPELLATVLRNHRP
jgi:hypothetical protein